MYAKGDEKEVKIKKEENDDSEEVQNEKERKMA